MSIAAKQLASLKGEKLKSVQRANSTFRYTLVCHASGSRFAPGEYARLKELERKGEIKLGSGELGPDFWNLPQPEDPTDSVRRALDESRG